MSYTALANVIQNKAFAQYFARAVLDRSPFFKSGIAVADPVIQQKCNEAGFGGSFVNLPFWNAVSTNDGEQRLDETDLTPTNITAGQDVAVIVRRGKAFGANDLAADVAGSDPMKVIADQLADYWNARNQTRLMKVLAGVFAANVAEAQLASKAPTLVLDISGETGNGGKDALLTKDTLLLAAQLLGDRKTELTAIAMHSMVETYLAGMDTNAGLYRASEGAATLAKYNGRDIIVDDQCSYNPSTGVAEIYLFGRGAIAYCDCPVKTPFEVGRNALTAGGQDYLVSRIANICHLRGYKWNVTDTNPANDKVGTKDQSGYIAGLSDAANWARVYDPKEIRCVKLVCKLHA